MDTKVVITRVDQTELGDAWGAIGEGLTTYNHHQAGDDHPQRICYVVRADNREILGGVVGVVYWDWLYVDLMWLKEELRGCGYGHQLLTRLEDEARQCGAKNVYLDTFSFQAPDFYKQHGYQEFGQLQNFPPGHVRYFMTKKL